MRGDGPDDLAWLRDQVDRACEPALDHPRPTTLHGRTALVGAVVAVVAALSFLIGFAACGLL